MKKSSSPLAEPARDPLPKVVSIESLRARREEASLREVAAREAGKDRSPSAEEPMSEAERDRLLEELRSELIDLPDVRLDKVIEARARIARGYYDSERVLLDTLEAMLEEERGPMHPAPDPASARSGVPAKQAGNAESSSAKKTPPSGTPKSTRTSSARTPKSPSASARMSTSTRTPSGNPRDSESSRTSSAEARTSKSPASGTRRSKSGRTSSTAASSSKSSSAKKRPTSPRPR